MQTRGSTNKSPIKLSAVENKLTRWFVYESGKQTRQKPYRVILRSPLPKFHYYHHKRLQVKEFQYFIPTNSWTLNPNAQLDLLICDNFSFWCTAPTTWLTNCADPNTRLQSPTRKGCWLQSFSVHPRWSSRRCLVTKPYGAQTQQLLHKNDELKQILSLFTICLNKLCLTLVQLVHTLTAFIIIILYV